MNHEAAAPNSYYLQQAVFCWRSLPEADIASTGQIQSIAVCAIMQENALLKNDTSSGKPVATTISLKLKAALKKFLHVQMRRGAGRRVGCICRRLRLQFRQHAAIPKSDGGGSQERGAADEQRGFPSCDGWGRWSRRQWQHCRIQTGFVLRWSLRWRTCVRGKIHSILSVPTCIVKTAVRASGVYRTIFSSMT